MEDEKKLEVDLDSQEVDDELKDQMSEADSIHIRKTDDDGSEVDIDIDKDEKTVNINAEKDGKKTKVQIGLSGIWVKDGSDSVNVQFWPILLIVAAMACGFFFFIYKVLELIFR